MGSNFSGLDGFFTAEGKRQLHTLTPEKHRTLVETGYLAEVVKGSTYAPEDVIGVAFATTHDNQGVQLRQLYLTQNGIQEEREPALAPEYAALRRQVMVKTGVLLPLFERKGFQGLAERFGKNPVEFHDLSGQDQKKRVLVVYSCDEKDYAV